MDQKRRISRQERLKNRWETEGPCIFVGSSEKQKTVHVRGTTRSKNNVANSTDRIIATKFLIHRDSYLDRNYHMCVSPRPYTLLSGTPYLVEVTWERSGEKALYSVFARSPGDALQAAKGGGFSSEVIGVKIVDVPVIIVINNDPIVLTDETYNEKVRQFHDEEDEEYR